MIRVLIVEDEPAVSEVLQRMLAGEGCEVQVAGPCIRPENPAACMIGCCSGEYTPDVVLVEVVAPRACSGLEAAVKAWQRWPKARILLTSGSASSDWPANAGALLKRLPERCYSFLPKPFTARQLRAAVAELLGHGPRGGLHPGLSWQFVLCGL